MTAPPDAEIIYHGYRSPTGQTVIVMETPEGEEIGPVRHVVRHSPTGLSWGYGGSGPADTARSVLLAALGPDALCGQCGGSGRVVHRFHGETREVVPYKGNRPPDSDSTDGLKVARCARNDCDDGYRQVPYQRFKQEFVTGWGWEWRISRTEVLEWLQETE